MKTLEEAFKKVDEALNGMYEAQENFEKELEKLLILLKKKKRSVFAI